MGSEEMKEIGMQKRLPTGDHCEMDPHLLAFPENPIHEREGQILITGILSGIATIATQITAHGRGKDEEARRVKASGRLGEFLPLASAQQELVQDEALHQLPPMFGIRFLHDPLGHSQAWMLVLEKGANTANLAFVIILLGQHLGQIGHANQVLIGATAQGPQ